MHLSRVGQPSFIGHWSRHPEGKAANTAGIETRLSSCTPMRDPCDEFFVFLLTIRPRLRGLRRASPLSYMAEGVSRTVFLHRGPEGEFAMKLIERFQKFLRATGLRIPSPCRLMSQNSFQLLPVVFSILN